MPTCPSAIDAPIGTRVMTSTPAAMTMSYAPAITPCAAKCADCCDEPHWRSTVVAGTVSGKPGGEHGVAADVRGLLADLHDAAHDHVVDQRGVELVALDERLQRLGGEVGRVPARQLAVALAAGGADGVDDDGGGHGVFVTLSERAGRVDRWVKSAHPTRTLPTRGVRDLGPTVGDQEGTPWPGPASKRSIGQSRVRPCPACS